MKTHFLYFNTFEFKQGLIYVLLCEKSNVFFQTVICNWTSTKEIHWVTVIETAKAHLFLRNVWSYFLKIYFLSFFELYFYFCHLYVSWNWRNADLEIVLWDLFCTTARWKCHKKRKIPVLKEYIFKAQPWRLQGLRHASSMNICRFESAVPNVMTPFQYK